MTNEVRRTTQEIVQRSAAFRGQGRFGEAIALVEDHIAKGPTDLELLTNLYLEVFYAAREGGDHGRVRSYAHLLNKREPGLPSVQPFL
jgi:hypothetical protein